MERLGPFASPPHMAVAVSGGPDSTALAVLARDWLRGRGGRLLALVVDHGLRPGSAAEAELVRARLADLGIPARILRREGPRPESRIQERAREARYALLLAACRKAGVGELLVGHQRDDLAETVAMREARGSDEAGLAGIPLATRREGVRILRPLLPFPRARILAFLRERGIPWVEDPSNRDPRFCRARLRLSGLDREALVARALAASRRRTALEARLHDFFAAHAEIEAASGAARIPEAAWRELEPELRFHVLSRLLAHVGGLVHPPRRRVVEALAAALAGGGEPLRRTAARCLVERRAGWIVVAREVRGLPEPAVLEPGRRLRWDGRLLLENAGPRPLQLRAAGTDFGGAGLRDLVPAWVPDAALAALPVVEGEGGPRAALTEPGLRVRFEPLRPLTEHGVSVYIASAVGAPT